MIRVTFLAALTALAACAAQTPAVVPTGTAPDSFKVDFETNRGSFVVQVNRAWAPRGADRFYALVQNHFYDEDRFFRVVPGFIVQFGLNGNPKVNEQWDTKIPDDSVRQPNARGTFTFATEGPNTRAHQVFINTGENSRLDRLGFAPIGRVIEGMGVVDSINAQYGEFPEQHFIQRIGNDYLNRMFPKLDFVVRASIVK